MLGEGCLLWSAKDRLWVAQVAAPDVLDCLGVPALLWAIDARPYALTTCSLTQIIIIINTSHTMRRPLQAHTGQQRCCCLFCPLLARVS
jgi:hypothetical protein